jgi:hypothetical protein
VRGHYPLVLDDVEPDTLLATDFNFRSDQGEAALFVQSDRSGVLADDARDQ